MDPISSRGPYAQNSCVDDGGEPDTSSAALQSSVIPALGGLSVSMSLSGSMGVRDADHDGEPEYCAKFSVPAFTIGACIERFW